MKRLTVILLVVGLMVFVGHGISSAQKSKVEKTPIKIGLVEEISGGAAALGRSQYYGARLAFDETNDKGGINGRPIKYFEGDDQGDPARAATHAKRMIERDEVAAIVGTNRSSCTLAMAEVINRTGGMPLMGASAASALFKYSWYFSACGSNPWLIESYLDKAVREDGHKKIGVAYVTYAYGIDGNEVTKKRINEKYGPEFGAKYVIGVPVEMGTTDCTMQVDQLKKAGVDAVLIYFTGTGEHVALHRSIRAAGWDVDQYTLGIWSDTVLIAQGPPILKGVKGACFHHEDKPEFKRMWEALQERYHTIPEAPGGSAEMYDITMALLEGMRRSKDPSDWRQVVKAVEGLKNMPMTSGKIGEKMFYGPQSEFDPKGDHSLLKLKPHHRYDPDGKRVYE